MLCSRNLLGIPLRKLGEDVKGAKKGSSLHALPRVGRQSSLLILQH